MRPPFLSILTLLGAACGAAPMSVDVQSAVENSTAANEADGPAAIEGAALPSETPTFSGNVASIIYRRCTACHHSEGAAPFPLITYRDVQKRARQIGIVTRDRYMPPWPPTPGYGDFFDSRALTDDELRTLSEWIEAGAPLGVAEEVPIAPKIGREWKLGTPDIVLSMSEAYTVPAEGFDIWRTFVIPTNWKEDKLLRAVEFRPSNERVVHHFVMYIDASGSARAKDAADPDVGFEGMKAEEDLLGEELYGWLPGMTPRALPDGAASRLPAGADLLLDTHFVPRGTEETVAIEVGLHLAKAPPTLFPTGIILIGPGATVPPGVSDYTITHGVTLPVDAEAVSIAPHAHFVCKAVSVWATLPNGEREELLDIADWDPNWQDVYRYKQPVKLPAGTRVEMAFTYDNSSENPRNPFSPPRRVVTGKSSYNEMAIAWITVTVRSREDRAALKAHFLPEYRAYVERATNLTAIWNALVAAHDVDQDGTLDPEEELRATNYVNAIWENERHLLTGFDKDHDGRIDDQERAYAELVVSYWNGRPVE